MTDDEGDASISQVETADFADHSTASGESKRNGSSARKGNGSEVSELFHPHHFLRLKLCSDNTLLFFIFFLKFLNLTVIMYHCSQVQIKHMNRH